MLKGVLKLFKLGLNESDTPITVMRTSLVNFVVIITLPFLIIMTAMLWIAKVYPSSFMVLIAVFSLLLVYYLNYRRKFVIARRIIILLLTIITGVTIALYGRSAEVQVLLISMMIYVYILFDSMKDWLMIGTVVVLSCFIPYMMLEHQGPIIESLNVPHMHFIVMGFAFLTISILAIVVMQNLKEHLSQKDAAIDAIAAQNSLLEQKNHYIQEQKEEIELFTSVAAHDLKTPVRTISSFIGLLEKTNTQNDKSAEYINQIKIGAEQLKALTQGIEKYRQIDNQALGTEYQDTAKIIKTITSQVNPHADPNIIISNSELPELKIGHEHLAQIFHPIIENGIKYNNAAIREVSITSTATDDQVLIKITDNGIGIDPEYLSYIFEPFKKLHSSHVYQGSGLGLSIAKRIINKYVGTIQVESSPSGSTFIIAFSTDLLL